MRDDQIEAYNLVRKAIKAGNQAEVTRLLVSDKSLFQLDTPFGTWLHMAAAHGKLEIAQWLIAQGLDVDSRGATIEWRPLDEAAAEGHLDVVKFLIDSGATLDVTDSVRNPLFAAIVGGISEEHTAVAKFLIDSGINTAATYNIGQMKNVDALEFAKEWGRTDIVKLLEEKHGRA